MPGARTRSPRDYLLLGAPARPAHPGARRRLLRPGRPQGARSTWSSSARRRACATTPRPCATGSPTEVADPDRRAWLDAQLVALETQAAGARRRRRCRTWSYVARCFAFAPPRRPTTRVRGGRRADRRAPARRRRRSRDRLEAWDAPLRHPGRPAAGGRRLAGRALPGPGGGDSSACPTARICASRSSRGQPWTAYNWYDGGRRSRVDVNTDLPVRAPDLIHVIAHETYPGHHLEHAWKEADLVDRGGRLEASILLINTPECLISEGLADLGAPVRRPARGAGRPPRRALRAGRARRRGRSGRGPRGRRAVGRHRWRRDAASAPIRGQRRASFATRTAARTTRSLAYLRDVGRYAPARGREARSSSSSTRCGGPTSSSTPRARRSSVAGWRRSRKPSVPAGSAGCSTSS